MPDPSVTLRMPTVWLWILRIGGGAVGFALALLAGSLVRWLESTIGDAPGLLRLAAALPPWLAAAVLTLVGLFAGSWLAQRAQQESLVLTVGPDSVRLQQDGYDRYLSRESIASVFLDGKFVVFLDSATRPIARAKASDLSTKDIQAAFERFGYPWRGTRDPHEDEFRQWIDGHPDVSDAEHRLFRARARALKEGKAESADELAQQLQEAGIVVRDRNGVQQYRRIVE
ncbi:MAG TPA: hypothetical protein VIL44_06615 [Micromonospora sp.]